MPFRNSFRRSSQRDWASRVALLARKYWPFAVLAGILLWLLQFSHPYLRQRHAAAWAGMKGTARLRPANRPESQAVKTTPLPMTHEKPGFP